MFNDLSAAEVSLMQRKLLILIKKRNCALNSFAEFPRGSDPTATDIGGMFALASGSFLFDPEDFSCLTACMNI